jgi:GT2 family glycosyltransferase
MKKVITQFDNGIEVVQNFEWDITKRKVCIFMPHYHDRKYTAFSLRNIKTTRPKGDYVVIVGCDNIDSDFEEFEGDNIYFFSIKRPGGSRNGCFVRNYAIKRCQSELFFQKDGEVVVVGDFIKHCIRVCAKPNQGWRAGNICVLTKEQTARYMSTGDSSGFIERPTRVIKEEFPDSVKEVKKILVDSNGQVNLTTYHHYAYCVRTALLQSINGYDEDFFSYGYEDSDMFCRLYGLGHRIRADYSCTAIHLCHPRGSEVNNVRPMADLFESKDPQNPVRNPNGWGDGV